MEVNGPKPEFNFSQAVLMQLGDKGLLLIDQDLIPLGPYGVDVAFRDDLQDKTEAFKIFPTDTEMKGKAEIETEIKDAQADELRVNIRTMMVKVSNKFDKNAGTYHLFGTQGLSDMNDLVLIRCGRLVVKMLTEYLTKFTNIDQPMVDELEAAVSAFDTTFDTQQFAIRKRKASTIDRTLSGNALYGKVSELFDYGKDYWSTRNYARYHDYVIYNTPSATPELSGTTGAAHGTMLDKVTNQPVAGGMVSLEFVDNPVVVDAAGNWACAEVPIECNAIWGMAIGHKLVKATIQIQANVDTSFDILIEPGTIPS